MAKRHKKFKKKINQNLSERIAQIQSETLKKSDQSEENNSDHKSPETPVDTSQTEKYAYVRKDIRRDFLIILFLVVLLTTATILNTKTDLLKNFSDWVYTILNLTV